MKMFDAQELLTKNINVGRCINLLENILLDASAIV